MNKKTQSAKKQTVSTGAATIEDNNINNAPAMPEQPETLCTIGGTPIKIGDTIRLKADTANGTAIIEVNPTDDSRNPDKPNGWRIDTREAYKALQKAMKGLRVSYAYTDDRRTRVEGQAVIVGCGMDSTNDRATLKLSTGSVIASGYCFKVLGFDSNYTHTERTTDTADTDNRPAALIRADIADMDKRIERLQAKREALQKALTKALETDLAAVRSILNLHPTNRAMLALAVAVPTANRIPQNVWQALQVMDKDNPVYCAMMSNYDDEQIQFAKREEDTPQLIANADSIAAIMAERGLKLGDIPTDILS